MGYGRVSQEDVGGGGDHVWPKCTPKLHISGKRGLASVARRVHAYIFRDSPRTGYGRKYRHARMQPPTLSPKASDAAASALHAPYRRLCSAEAAEA